MAESTSGEAKQTEKTRSSVRPARERAVHKQLVSIRHGATANELIEDDRDKGDGIRETKEGRVGFFTRVVRSSRSRVKQPQL